MEELEKLREEDYNKWASTIESFLGEGTTTPSKAGQERYSAKYCKSLDKKVAERKVKAVTDSEVSTQHDVDNVEDSAKRQRVEN